MKKIGNILVILFLLSGLLACADTTSKMGQGTAIGTGVGAGVGGLLGQAIGRNTEGTMIGIGVGAALGGVAGNRFGWYMDNQEQELRSVLAVSELGSIRRNQEVLTTTFKGETFFDHNSSRLKPGGNTEINRVVSVIKRYPDTRIQVTGHADASGVEVYNQQLSLERAESVKSAMVTMGVNPSRINTIGVGESQPVSSDYAMNRRVEIAIIPFEETIEVMHRGKV